MKRNAALEMLRAWVDRHLTREPDIEGVVSNIQKFSINDGPGIRTTVFLKGCPLRCSWCSNPESINPSPEIITNFADLCSGCNRCLQACGRGAIVVSAEAAPADPRADRRSVRTLDRDRCDGCMQCVETCPTGALRSVGKTLTVREVMNVVEQDLPFYRTSGGGVTLSGGEPLLQPDFARSILRESNRRGIHTALDTCGMAPLGAIEALLPYLDLVLYDVKHLDPETHKRFTGSDNAIILDNLRHLDKRVDIWLRVPLIPGFNDDDETILEILALGKRLSVQKLCILPYHRWGTGKYPGLGREYPFPEAGPISEEKLRYVERASRSMGLENVEISSD